jgi:hypothetical protein
LVGTQELNEALDGGVEKQRGDLPPR